MHTLILILGGFAVWLVGIFVIALFFRGAFRLPDWSADYEQTPLGDYLEFSEGRNATTTH